MTPALAMAEDRSRPPPGGPGGPEVSGTERVPRRDVDAASDRAVVYLLPSGAQPSTAPTLTADVRPYMDTDPDLDTDPDTADIDDVANADDAEDTATERADWAWVEEWRAEGEPTPWATGLPLALFSALIVGTAVWVLSAGLSDRPVIAVVVNLLVAGGLAPAIWLSRGLPVLRWIAAGSATGVVVGWISALVMLPLPLP